MIQQAPTQKILRSQIDFAAYNPRRISEGNKGRLKKSLKEFGLVGDLTWNKRTGRLVSGHQRLSLMDDSARGKDYEVEVRVVDLDEKAEFRLNVMLNNHDAQGEYDFEALKAAAEDYEVDLGDLGFAAASLMVDFDFDTGLDDAGAQDIGDAKQHKLDARAKHQAAGANGETNATDSDSADYAFAVVFESNSQKSTFLGKLGFAGNSKVVNAELLIATFRQKMEQGLM